MVRVIHLRFTREVIYGDSDVYTCNWKIKARKFRMTTDFKKVTCKKCLGMIDKWHFNQKDFKDDESI